MNFSSCRRLKRRSQSAPIVLFVLALTVSACGPGVNAQDTDVEKAPSVSAPSALESPLFNTSRYRYTTFCIVPDELYEIKRDAQLVDSGLLLPEDVEQNLRTLGTAVIQNMEWITSDWQLIENNPDPDLLKDYEDIGMRVLQSRLELLRGNNISLLEIVDELDNLAARGNAFCDWLDTQR